MKKTNSTKKQFKKEKTAALACSAAAFIVICFAMYSIFVLIGLDHIKAIIESIILSATIDTLVILYLFGKIWLKE